MYIANDVVYADVLFVINFAADFLCLFIAGRINKRGGRLARLISAAAAGGLYAFLPYAAGGIPAPLQITAHLAAAALMVFIAFGTCSGIKRFFLTYLSFAVTAALLGGLMTAVYNLSGGTDGTYFSGGRLKFLFICVISAAAALIYGFVTRNGKKAKSCEVRIYLGGEKIDVRLLIDSGNLVSEPFSALPVIVLSSTALPPPYDMPQSEFFPLPLRAIPITTGAGKGCLYGFRPEKAELIGPAKKPTKIEAYIGIDTVTGSFSGYDGLMPAELV